MAHLITPQEKQKSPADARLEERIRNSREGFASFNKTMAQQGTTKAEGAPVHRSFVSAFGGASNLPEAQAIRTAQKSDLEALPANIQALAGRTPLEGLKFMAAMVKRYDETLQPVAFTSEDAAKVMDLTPAQAGKITDNLIFQGLLIPRNGRSGGLQGYQPVLPA